MAFLQKNINDMYRRALAALTAEFGDLPADSAGAAAEGLRERLAIMDQKGGSQAGFDGAAQAGSAQRAVDRRGLYDYLATLARTAKTIERRKPGFSQYYPSPSGKNDQELLNDARAVAPQALKDEADFVYLGLTKEFVEMGAELLDAFAASFAATNEALASRGAAVGSKKEAAEDADDFFDDLDRYIRNRYRDQPDKLAAWKIATHIERSGRKRDDDEPKP